MPVSVCLCACRVCTVGVARGGVEDRLYNVLPTRPGANITQPKPNQNKNGESRRNIPKHTNTETQRQIDTDLALDNYAEGGKALR